MNISVIIPIYNEENSITSLHASLKSALVGISKEYEIIFVNDFSDDNSLSLLRGIKNQDKNVRVLNLNKKYGQIKALTIGVQAASGDIIITMDGDLQYNPFEISIFVEKIREGYDVVGGVRPVRLDCLYRTTISKLANFLIRKILRLDIKDLGCSFNAFKSSLYKKLHLESSFLSILTKPFIVRCSKNYTEIKVTHYPRAYGKSKNRFLDLIKLFLITFLTAHGLSYKFKCYNAYCEE